MCLFIVALFMPRTLMFFIWLLTDYFSRAFDGWFWPLLGFFFMPFTTLSYMLVMLSNNHQYNFDWAIFTLVAILLDIFGFVANIAAASKA